MKYILRIIVLPIILLLAIVGSIRTLIKTLIDFMRFGGEFIVLENDSIKTTLDKLVKEYEKNQ